MAAFLGQHSATTQARQYVAFVLIMFGILLRPTILKLAMFPILCFMYWRLAITEEKDAQQAFGEGWESYAARTPSLRPTPRSCKPP